MLRKRLRVVACSNSTLLGLVGVSPVSGVVFVLSCRDDTSGDRRDALRQACPETREENGAKTMIKAALVKLFNEFPPYDVKEVFPFEGSPLAAYIRQIYRLLSEQIFRSTRRSNGKHPRARDNGQTRPG